MATNTGWDDAEIGDLLYRASLWLSTTIGEVLHDGQSDPSRHYLVQRMRKDLALLWDKDYIVKKFIEAFEFVQVQNRRLRQSRIELLKSQSKIVALQGEVRKGIKKGKEKKKKKKKRKKKKHGERDDEKTMSCSDAMGNSNGTSQNSWESLLKDEDQGDEPYVREAETVKAETVRAETVKAETVKAETVKAETVKVETMPCSDAMWNTYWPARESVLKDEDQGNEPDIVCTWMGERERGGRRPRESAGGKKRKRNKSTVE